VDADDLESMFTEILGDHPFGWINFIAVIILCVCLFSFGEVAAGISLIGTGFTFLFINIFIIGFVATTVIPILLLFLDSWCPG